MTGPQNGNATLAMVLSGITEPLLRPEEEVELGKAIEAGLYAEHLLRSGADRAELKILVREGQAAFDRFVLANVRLAAWLARRCAAVGATGGLSAEDLTAEGVQGAIREFVAREGHCRPRFSHFEELPDFSVPLYDWCTRQRHLYRHGQLLPARAQRLEAVAGWQWERQPAPRVLLDIGDTRHGERTGYVKGCHCDECTEANRLKAVERTARAAAGGPTTDLVDASAAREHLADLSAQGASQKSLAGACGLNVKTIVQVLCGETRRILPETEEAIRALSVAAVRSAAAPGTRVDAGPTWDLLDDMIGRGWPKSWIARELGLGNSLQLSRDTITASNADKVAEVARRLGDRTPPPRRRRLPVPSLEELLAAAAPATDEFDDDAIEWARSLLDQGYHIHRAAQRSGLPVEVITAMADNTFDEERTA